MNTDDYELIKTFNDPDGEITSERNFPLCLVSGTKFLPMLTVELYVKWYTLYLVDRTTTGQLEVHKVWYSALEDFRPEDQSAFVDHVPNPLAVRNFANAKNYLIDELADDLLMGRWQNEVVDQDTLCPLCGGTGTRPRVSMQDPSKTLLERCRHCKGRRTVKRGA